LKRLKNLKLFSFSQHDIVDLKLKNFVKITGKMNKLETLSIRYRGHKRT